MRRREKCRRSVSYTNGQNECVCSASHTHQYVHRIHSILVHAASGRCFALFCFFLYITFVSSVQMQCRPCCTATKCIVHNVLNALLNGRTCVWFLLQKCNTPNILNNSFDGVHCSIYLDTEINRATLSLAAWHLPESLVVYVLHVNSLFDIFISLWWMMNEYENEFEYKWCLNLYCEVWTGHEGWSCLLMKMTLEWMKSINDVVRQLSARRI